MNKITIIGTGSVGSTIAYTLAINGTAQEIVMIDINGEKALGESMDIRQGTPFSNPCSVYAGNYEDAIGSNIVIITCGLPRKAGQSRLDLAQTNVDILRGVTKEILRYAPGATYIIVSNPVDIMTYAICKFSGLPENRVIGSGTLLDTSRLRSRVSEYYGINQRNVHAYVLGEHGDSSFVPWSVANISNVPIDDYHNAVQANMLHPELNKQELEEYVRKSGAHVIQRKGATFYAVSMSVSHICKCLLSGVDTTMTVSTMMHGEYGIEDVCLSVLNIVGNKGAYSKVLLPLNEKEVALLQKSAESLKEVIKGIKL